MEALTLAQLLQAVGGTLIGGEADLNQTVTEVCTDSRSVPQGCLFLPLEGERFDGHAYINAALEGGAAGCLTQRERESYLPGKFYIKVPNTTRALREKRSTSHYRGVKKYDNTYSGFLVCGDCGAPMFAMSRSDLRPAYTCGTYHRRGLKGCTSHHIRVDKLDELLKSYVQQVMDHSSDMLQRLNEDLARQQEDVAETEQSADHLAEVLVDLQEELKVTKRQRIRDLMKHPEQEELLEQTYDELEADLQKRIEGISHQIEMLSDKRNTIIQVNRAARTAMEVFDDILSKDTLERNDLELIIRQIKVYEDHLEIQLQSDVDAILRSGTLEGAVNFNEGMGHISSVTIVQESNKHLDKVFHANVISDGDPSQTTWTRWEMFCFGMLDLAKRTGIDCTS